MLRDEKLFPMATSQLPSPPVRQELEEVTVQLGSTITYENNDFDDVFGDDDDGMRYPPGDAGPVVTTTLSNTYPRSGYLEPSDIPRLKEKHETEGYRDGVTAGKRESVQTGFDEGYGLGALLGLKAGKLLGLLEGILSAVFAGIKSDGPEVWKDERQRLEALWKLAVEELGTKGIFATEYWDGDGIWKFVVQGDESGEVVFPDIVGAHPMVKKWQTLLDEEINRWGLDLQLMDAQVGGNDGSGDIQGNEAGKDKHARPFGEPAVEPASGGPGKIMGISKQELNW